VHGPLGGGGVEGDHPKTEFKRKILLRLLQQLLLSSVEVSCRVSALIRKKANQPLPLVNLYLCLFSVSTSVSISTSVCLHFYFCHHTAKLVFTSFGNNDDGDQESSVRACLRDLELFFPQKRSFQIFVFFFFFFFLLLQNTSKGRTKKNIEAVGRIC
jgi:hypothetical protein